MDKITESKFLTELAIELSSGSDGIWSLKKGCPLIYQSVLLQEIVYVPPGALAITFYTDLASVPRVPLVFEAWGNRAHREAVLHDYLYCKNSNPLVTFMMANRVFLEAMISRQKPFYVAYPMFYGVCLGGYSSYHKRNVEDRLGIIEVQEHKEETVTQNIKESEKQNG